METPIFRRDLVDFATLITFFAKKHDITLSEAKDFVLREFVGCYYMPEHGAAYAVGQNHVIGVSQSKWWQEPHKTPNAATQHGITLDKARELFGYVPDITNEVGPRTATVPDYMNPTIRDTRQDWHRPSGLGKLPDMQAQSVGLQHP